MIQLKRVKKNNFNYLLLFILLGLCWFNLVSQEDPIATGEITVQGVSIKIDPAQQTVPINTETVVNTIFEKEDPGMLEGMVVKGKLRGPGINGSITLTTLPNHPFVIPGFPVRGTYTLEDVHLERDGDFLVAAEPDTAVLDVMDIIVTEVKSRPLTLDEIREKGIVISEENFSVYNFSVGFVVKSEVVKYEFPVVYSGNTAYVPPVTPKVDIPDIGSQRRFTPETTIPITFTGSGLPGGEITEEGNIEDPGSAVSGVIIINNDIAFLNQFFSIMFIVSNSSPEGSNLTLKDLKAKITFPEGLREAETNPPHVVGSSIPVRCPGPDGKIGTADDLDIILATFSGMAEFLAEGLKEGTHIVDIDFEGTLSGLPSGDTPVNGSASGAVIVKNAEFSITFSHPRIIRKGEEYDIYVTMTNISPLDANLVSLTMPASGLIGTALLSDETVSFETLSPGESETAKFHMVAKETGKITASAFAADGNVTGKFVLTAGVGEHGIPLSPDTLVLPDYAYLLPDNLVEASLILLGEAYSIATTPPGGLPEELPYIGVSIVRDRVLEFAEAGQRIDYGESLIKTVEHLTLDWLGNSKQDINFDILRRLTSKGIKFAKEQSNIFNEELKTTNPANFHISFAERCSFKHPFVSALLSFGGGARCASINITDYYQNRLSDVGIELIRDIPYGELYFMEDGSQSPVDFALIGHLEENDHSYTVEIIGETEGTFDLSLIVPDVNGGFRQMVFTNVSSTPGSVSSISVNKMDESFTLSTDLDGDGTADAQATGDIIPVQEPPLQLISATQDCSADPAGHATALFFNRPVDPETAKNESNFYVEGKKIYASFLQPSGRIILIGTNNPISPFVESRIRVENLKDTKGGLLTPSPVEKPILATIDKPGGIVYGQVFTPDGLPVSEANIHLVEKTRSSITRCYAQTDSSGNYQFDFVRMLPESFTIEVQDPDTGRVDKVSSRIMTNGQRLKIDIHLHGVGSIKGKVLNTDGTIVPDAVVFAKEENSGIFEYFKDETDENGEFLFPYIPLGRIELSAYCEDRYGASNTTISAPGEMQEVEITVVEAKTASASGRVLENDCVTPVAGTYVNFFGPHQFGTTVQTDDNGYFHFPKVPVGNFRIDAYNPTTGMVGGSVSGSVVEGQESNVTIIFRGCGRITGKVKDHNGTPLPGILVYIQGTNFYMDTDTNGEFDFPEVPIGSYLIKAYNRTTYDNTRSSVRLITEGEEVHTILVFTIIETGKGGIRGTVYNPDGVTPAPYASIDICDRNYFVKTTLDTDASGNFQVDDLPLGGYIIAAEGSGSSGVSNTSIQFHGHLAQCDVQLKGKGTVNINVFAPDGQTGIMADVTFRGLKFKDEPGDYIGFLSKEENHKTDENGHLSIGNVFMGRVSAFTWNEFYPTGASYNGSLTTPDQVLDIDLVMTPTGKVKATVVDYDGVTIVPGAALLFNTSTYSLKEPVYADENGEYEFVLVPPGYFSVKASENASGELNCRKGSVSGSMGYEGETVEVTVRLRGRGQVSGAVRNEDDVAIPDANVTLKNLGFPYETSTATSGPDGRFTFENVSEGPFSLSVSPANSWKGGKALGEVPAHNAEVELDVYVTTIAHGSVSGKVLSPDSSTEMTDVEVVLTHSRYNGETIGYFYVTEEGGFLFEDIPEGSFKVEVLHPASGRKGRAFGTLDTEGENVVLDITLEGRGTVTGTFFDGSQTIPIPNAPIKIKSKGLYPFELVSSTNVEGDFTFQEVGKGSFDLEATDEGNELMGTASGEVEYDGQTVYINVYAQGTGSVNVYLFNADGTVYEGMATISLKAGNKTYSASYDNSGGNSDYVQVDIVPVGRFSVKAFKLPGLRDVGTASGTLEFHGQQAVVNLTFQGLGTVTGRVLDGSGNPVSDVAVNLRSNSEKFPSFSGNSGEFSFENLRMGTFSLEAIDSSGLCAAGNGELTTDGQVITIDLILESAGSVSGRILMSDGTTPAENAYITLKGSDFIKYGSPDSSGHFLFDAVKLGSFILEVRGYGEGGEARVGGQLESPGQTFNCNDIVLDDVAPAVVNVSPADGSALVPLNSVVTVSFSEEMSDASINNSTIKLTSNWGNTSGSVVLSADSKSMVFTPSSPLRSFALYTLVINSAVEDAAGNELDETFTTSFTTSDIEPPVVVSMVPANNAFGVLIDSVITVFFNEPVDPSQFNGGNMTVTNTIGGAAVPGTITFNQGNMSAVFTPASLATDSTYSVSVQQAVDFAGNVQAVPFGAVFSTVDTIAPFLQLVPPAGGTSVIEGSTVQISADTGTSTDISVVHFFIDGEIKHSDNNAPYNFQFTAPLINEGGSTFLVEAYAVDHEGNQSTRENLMFTLVSDTPPQVTLTGPSETTVYPGGTISCSVSASDDLQLARVTVTAVGGTLNYTNTQTVSQSSFSKNYAIEVPSDILPATEILLHAETEDIGGSIVSADDVTIHVPQDEQNPVVTITSPSEGARFEYNEVVTIEAEASDDVGIKQVRIYLDDQLLATHTQAPYTASYTVPPLEEEKPSVVKVEAEDLSGKVSEDTVNIVLEQLIDVDAPKVKILSPSDGSLVYADENLKIKVEASDDEGVERVEIYVDDQLVHTDTEEPYETVYTIPMDASPGSTITFKAVATDVGDKSTTEHAIVEVVTGTVLPDGTVIETDDTNYDNQTIIINEGTVTITGSHTFTHVLVKESGILTHKGSTTSAEYKMELTITGKLVIGIDAKISANSCGYLGGYNGGNNSKSGITFGNTNTGGSFKTSGGSYGGYGGIESNNPVNEVYGSIYNPSDPGSGGGGRSLSYYGRNGGGVIRIESGEVINDGGIYSNGGNGGNSAGAGSGGSVYIKATTLKGGGSITANGGTSSFGAGGGGRIALYYDDASEFDLLKIFAYGGATNNSVYTERNGGAGTIYLKKQGEPGQIIINNGGTPTLKSTPLTSAAPGRITALSETVLTDEYANFVPGSLVGMLLQPNIAGTETFRIISNTVTQIEVETTDVLLTDVAKVDDYYRVKHPANLLLEDGDTHISGTVNVSAVTLVNTTLTLDGTLFVDGSLSLQSGSQITHSTATIETIFNLQIEADEIVIDESSTIDVTARGYLGGYQGENTSTFGRTINNSTTGGSNKTSGGSFGGFGGMQNDNDVNEIYGSIYNPSDPGSGGGGQSSNAPGRNGGGVIRIDVGELVNNGGIYSNGGNAGSAGAGSGGSIYIKALRLRGGGTITAQGGNSGFGAGGGGRIAVLYEEASEFDLSTITAYGGTTNNAGYPERNGSAGSVYLEKNNEQGELVINNRGQESNNTLIFPIIEPADITSVSASVLQNNSANYMPRSLIGMKLIPNMDNPDNTVTIIDNDRTSITVDGDLTGMASAGDTYTGIMVLNGHLQIINTAAEIGRDVELGNLTISENGSLTHPGATITTVSYLDIKADKVTIETGSRIDVKARGYLGGYQGENISYYGRTLGNTNTGGSYRTSGGSFGGYGGIENNNPVNEVYGSIYKPSDPGSGGGARGISYPGRNGGGVIRMDVGDLVINGGIYSDGGNAGNSAGAGSGGSIYIKASTLKGGGFITAHGGNSGYGAGGGGRIAVYYDDASEFDLSTITAYGGATTNASFPDRNGGAGTIYIKKSSAAYGDLIVDNNNISSREDSTTLPAVGQGTNTALEANTLVNDNASFIPGALIGIKLNPDPIGSTVFTIISNTSTKIFTDPADGKMTDEGLTGGAYIGEHYLFNLTIKGYAKVSTTDRIQVSGTLIVEPGSTLEAENHQ